MTTQITNQDGSISLLDRYAQLRGDTVIIIIESKFDPDGINGKWVRCPDHVGPGFTVDAEHTMWIPPVFVTPTVQRHATKRAFQNRFPKISNGISTKYDAMCLFLTDDSYAAYLGVTGSALFEIRMLITTGVQRMNASPFVDMSPNAEAATLTALLMHNSIPEAFRLTAGEREGMLETPLTDVERYTT